MSEESLPTMRLSSKVPENGCRSDWPSSYWLKILCVPVMGCEPASLCGACNGSMFSNRLNVLSVPVLIPGPCKQNADCTESAFLCRFGAPEAWYIAPLFQESVLSDPRGEGTEDMAAGHPELGFMLPDGHVIVSAFVP